MTAAGTRRRLRWRSARRSLSNKLSEREDEICSQYPEKQTFSGRVIDHTPAIQNVSPEDRWDIGVVTRWPSDYDLNLIHIKVFLGFGESEKSWFDEVTGFPSNTLCLKIPGQMRIIHAYAFAI